ncbi:MAG: hypothetical protein ABW049_04910 [Spongiibacteraceae bacterium]
MSTYKFLVFSNPQSGREDEYNEWYEKRHLPDLLKIPGVVAAQRFRVADDNGTHAHRYVAIYEIEADNADAVMAEINTRAGTEAMPISDAMDASKIAMTLFAATAPRQVQ